MTKFYVVKVETMKLKICPVVVGASEVYLTEEVAELIKFHPETVRRLVREGRIQAMKFGRDWRIPNSEVQRILREGLPKGSPSPEKKSVKA